MKESSSIRIISLSPFLVGARRTDTTRIRGRENKNNKIKNLHRDSGSEKNVYNRILKRRGKWKAMEGNGFNGQGGEEVLERID